MSYRVIRVHVQKMSRVEYESMPEHYKLTHGPYEGGETTEIPVDKLLFAHINEEDQVCDDDGTPNL